LRGRGRRAQCPFNQTRTTTPRKKDYGPAEGQPLEWRELWGNESYEKTDLTTKKDY